MEGDEGIASPFCIGDDAGHDKVIDANDVGQPDALAFQRDVIVVIVLTEGRCGASESLSSHQRTD